MASARRRFLLVAPVLRAAVVTDGLIAQLEMMLRRRDLVARIAYGLGHPDRDHDADALERLTCLADAHVNLSLVRAHDLIFDDTWANTGFDWLSFGGPDRVYRREEGTLIRSAAVDDRYAHCASELELAFIT
ncbi:hypothetical protein BS329_39450 [Amycolatopsis coloradensis]|uniref:Uncharacterized protein n=1 Tax=Amycolatopsis coloradensis TaxID=76021 RepID=A0A1R0KEH0_9PSEU|nr:hypothetical protein [Amycolatopsis coloradensis]OLZ43400.1 hypothetical protein BS329_39450 [Amycolatopsis coloradensis]